MSKQNCLHGLYVITDETLIPEKQFIAIIEQALLGGASIIQYRDKSDDLKKQKKQTMALRVLCNQYKALLLINDNPELARLANADGVHLGKQDTSISEARKILGDKAIIGVSCYNQLELAINGENAGADYVAFGAVYTSATKPNACNSPLSLLTEAKTRLTVPICAIGGINHDNAQQIFDAGVDMVAVINGVFNQPDITVASRQIADLAKINFA